MSSGRLILPITEPILTATGEPDGGATLTVYNTGTNIVAAIYADAGLTTSILNPQTANQAGRFYEQSTLIWADASIAYDAVVNLTDGSSLSFSDIYVLGQTPNVSSYAPLNSPAFTGVPTAPTPSLADSSGKLATTAYVQGQGYAESSSPTFTGTPAAPTAAPGTNTTQLATTAFVTAAIAAISASTTTTVGPITITAGTSGALTYTLPVTAVRAELYLLCTASTRTYVANSIISLGAQGSPGGSGGSFGASAWIVNSGQIGFAIGSNGIQLLDGTTGNQFTASASNFQLYVRLYTN